MTEENNTTGFVPVDETGVAPTTPTQPVDPAVSNDMTPSTNIAQQPETAIQQAAPVNSVVENKKSGSKKGLIMILCTLAFLAIIYFAYTYFNKNESDTKSSETTDTTNETVEAVEELESEPEEN